MNKIGKKMTGTLIIISLVALSAMGYRHHLSGSFVDNDKPGISQNHPNGKFVNSLPSNDLTFRNLRKMAWEYMRGGEKDRQPAKPLSVLNITDEFFGSPGNDIRFAWLGHSSIILEIEGKRLLLDPVLSERASPVQWAGPKRFHPPPITMDNLPNLDAVIISHDHYDHLDKAVILALAGRDIVFLVPLGIKKRLRNWGVAESKIFEMNWWDEFDLGDLTIVATPARHFSGRGLFDRDLTLWCSWSLIGKEKRVFFSGDTGITPEFEEVGQNYGPFDLTFLKIAAYDETWPSIHINPEQAVIIHKQLNGKYLVPIHWATFDLGLHSWYAPPEWLVKETAVNNVNVVFPRIGEVVNPEQHENSYWWREFMNNKKFSEY